MIPHIHNSCDSELTSQRNSDIIEQKCSQLTMSSQRPLPVPPYPGIIPYHVDQDQQHHQPAHLLTMEHSPASVGSFGPSSCQTVPGLAAQQDLSEEQVRDKFYKYWERHKVGTETMISFTHYILSSIISSSHNLKCNILPNSVELAFQRQSVSKLNLVSSCKILLTYKR